MDNYQHKPKRQRIEDRLKQLELQIQELESVIQNSNSFLYKLIIPVVKDTDANDEWTKKRYKKMIEEFEKHGIQYTDTLTSLYVTVQTTRPFMKGDKINFGIAASTVVVETIDYDFFNNYYRVYTKHDF